MAWTDEQKTQAIDKYKAGNPTADNSTEIIKEIADELEQTVNGVRMILMQAGVYVKKDAAAATAAKGKAEGKAPRVSKEDQINALRVVIEAKGAEVDDEILTKLTGKAAAYFLKVLES